MTHTRNVNSSGIPQYARHSHNKGKKEHLKQKIYDNYFYSAYQNVLIPKGTPTNKSNQYQFALKFEPR